MDRRIKIITNWVKQENYQIAEREIAKFFLDCLMKEPINKAKVYRVLEPLYRSLWPLENSYQLSEWIWDVFLELDFYETYTEIDIDMIKDLAQKALN